MRIPMQLLVLDAVGTLIAAIGVAGLVSDVSRFLPFMTSKDIAGVFAAAGFALMTFAMIKIVRHLRAPRPPSSEPS
jgi:hypothetical protein